MRVEWTEHAKKQKKQIANYIRKRFGTRYATEFKHQVDQSVKMIMLHPNIGPFDPVRISVSIVSFMMTACSRT